MKDTAQRRVEVIANISIVVVALVGTVALIRNQLLPQGARTERVTPPVSSGPVAGTRISLPGVDWSDARQTLLIALSKECRFCSESAPLYERLAREAARRKDVRLIAVFPQDGAEARKYLDELGVPIQEIRQAQLDSIGARATPTLVLVDKAGVVTNSWVGRLPAEKESEVIARLEL